MLVVCIHCQIWPPDPSGPVLLIHLRLYLCAWWLIPVICKQSYPISLTSCHTGAKHSVVTSHERLHHKEPFQVGLRGWALHMIPLEVRVTVESIEMTHRVNLLGKGHQEWWVTPWSWSKILHVELSSLTKTKRENQGPQISNPDKFFKLY